MTPQSAKNKGRIHQQWVRDKLLENAPELDPSDIASTSMGAGGEDVKLSAAARKVYPVQIECKSRNQIALYKDYQQAMTHGPHEPVVIIKQNRSKPLALVDAEWFFKLLKGNREGN